MDGHAECVRFVKGFNLPTLILGGGGYTIRNVSRVWAYETGILVGCEMDRRLPMNDYMDYYAPEYTLDVPAYNAENSNSPEYLERIKTQVLQNLDRTRFAPSVQMQDVPRDADDDLADEDVLDPEERMPETARDQHVVPDAEMYEADSMGLNESAKDGTKVVNEEINDMADKSVTDEDTVMKVDNEGDSSKSVNATASRFNDGGEAMDVDDEGDVGPSSSDNVTGAASSVPVVEPPLRETAAGVEAPIKNPSEPVAIHADGDQSSSNNERAQASSASPPLAASTAAESKNETANPTISDDAAKDSESAAAIGSKTETGGNKEKNPSNESSSPSKQPPSTENDAAAESTTHASDPTSKNNSTSTNASETKSREEYEHQSVAIQASKHERKDTVEESAQTNNSPEQSKSDNTSVTGSAAEKGTPQSSAAASEPGLAAKSVPVAAIATGGPAPFVKAIQDIQAREKEEGEATEDDSENGDEDEDGEIRDT
ncbi:histone deacetylase [Coemansia sp. RSA 1933]|nr:histone deacetylase [Coemansia sp. RSA 1933]